MTLGPRRVRPHSGAGRARDPGLSWRRPHVHAPPCRPPGRRCFRVACLNSLSRTLSGASRQHSPGRGPAGLVIAAPGPWPGGSVALSLSEAPCGPGSCREWPIRCRLSELQFEALRLATARRGLRLGVPGRVSPGLFAKSSELAATTSPVCHRTCSRAVDKKEPAHLLKNIRIRVTTDASSCDRDTAASTRIRTGV